MHSKKGYHIGGSVLVSDVCRLCTHWCLKTDWPYWMEFHVAEPTYNIYSCSPWLLCSACWARTGVFGLRGWIMSREQVILSINYYNFPLQKLFFGDHSHSVPIKRGLFSLPCHVACRILVLQSGIKPLIPAVEAWNSNYWTTREVLMRTQLKYFLPQPMCHQFSNHIHSKFLTPCTHAKSPQSCLTLQPYGP